MKYLVTVKLNDGTFIHLTSEFFQTICYQLSLRCSQSGEHVGGTKLILVRFPHSPFWVYFINFWLVICSYTSLLMHG